MRWKWELNGEYDRVWNDRKKVNKRNSNKLANYVEDDISFAFAPVRSSFGAEARTEYINANRSARPETIGKVSYSCFVRTKWRIAIVCASRILCIVCGEQRYIERVARMAMAICRRPGSLLYSFKYLMRFRIYASRRARWKWILRWRVCVPLLCYSLKSNDVCIFFSASQNFEGHCRWYLLRNSHFRRWIYDESFEFWIYASMLNAI